MILVLMDELYPRSSLYAEYPELANRSDVKVGKSIDSFYGYGEGNEYLLYKGHSGGRTQTEFMCRASRFGWTRYERRASDARAAK